MILRKFIYFLSFTVLLIFLAIFSTYKDDSSNLFAERGDVFLKNLTAEINNINKISILGRELDMELVKYKNKFIDPSGYPFKEGVWESFITSLSLLRIEEKKTNDPDRLKELNLISIDKFDKNDDVNDPATKIVFYNKNNNVFKSILLGKIDRTVGGISGGQFGRFEDNFQSYLLKGALRMPSGKSDWFQSLLFQTQKDDLVSVKLINERTVFEVENKEKKLKLKNNPDLNIDDEKLTQISEIIESFYFYDVRKDNPNIEKKGPKLVFNLKEGFSINIKFVEKKKNSDEAWVLLSSVSKNKKSDDKSKEINKKTTGFQFLANINTSEVLNWRIKNLIKKKN